MLRPSSARALKRRTKRITRTARHMKQRDRRQHNSSSPSSLIPGYKNSETQKPFTQRLPRRTSYHTSKQVTLAGTPSTSWHGIIKCSVITSSLRYSLSILICSSTPRGKPAERGEQLPTKPYYFSPPLRCSQQNDFRALMMIGKSVHNEKRRGFSGSCPTRRPTLRRNSRHRPMKAL